jgi:flagellar biosynthesis anti-sigma factor FlgM
MEFDNNNPSVDPAWVNHSVSDQEISHLIKLIQSTPGIRGEKVAKIQRAIQNGTYSATAEQIADKIIDGNLIAEV